MAAIILSLLAAALLSTVLLIPAGHLKQALGIPSAVCSAAAMGLYLQMRTVSGGPWYRNSTGAAVPSLRCLRTGDPGRRGPGSDRMVLRKKAKLNI